MPGAGCDRSARARAVDLRTGALVLRDPRLHMPVGMFLAGQGITSGPLWDRIATNLISLDGAEHHRLRRLVSTAFTPRATGRLREIVVDVITELVDEQTAEGSCDVVTDIARRYPIPVICALLGAPATDWELFSDWTDDIFKAFSWNAAAEMPAILSAWDEFDDYLDDMVAHRRAALTDDLLSDLIRAEDQGDRLTADELRMLAVGLLIAGTDTTRNQLAASVDVLCDHPDAVAPAGRAARVRRQRGRGNAASLSDRVRHLPHRRRGRRARRGQDPGRHDDRRQHRGRKPRPGRLRRPRPVRRHPRRRAGDADVRRRHALLPGREPRPARARRGAGRHDAAHAGPAARRRGPVETAHRGERTTTLPIEFDPDTRPKYRVERRRRDSSFASWTREVGPSLVWMCGRPPRRWLRDAKYPPSVVHRLDPLRVALEAQRHVAHGAVAIPIVAVEWPHLAGASQQRP